ncbi:MAG: type I restriction endonuclease [Candidatus Peregrinibacteria bacterium]
MEINDSLKALSDRLQKIRDTIKTEEATKNALVMPFIQILGYDVFDPLEVIPEFIADIGIKKGEKVDYAIAKDGKPMILIECKNILEKLDLHGSQLFRYFHTTNAKFAILTNGVEYRFYTDLNEPNKMDDKPFLSFEITALNERTIEELKKFHKSYFDIDAISNNASELKYGREIKIILEKELESVSDEFVHFFAKKIYAKKLTEKAIKMLSEVVKKSFSEFIKDQVNDRLKLALTKENKKDSDEEMKNQKESKIVTTEEEIESFFVVKSILRDKVDISRVYYRDVESYFGILFDNNNRKPICRMYLDGAKKYISLIDAERNEVKKQIDGLNDIYKYAEEIIKIAEYYQSQ